MLVKTVRNPGEPGTRRLAARYGERLICVRYRYDPIRQRRYKTIELIVEEQAWVPPPEPELEEPRHAPRRVGVRIGYHERELRRKIKAAGGTWSEQERLWRVSPDAIETLGLEARVVRR
jgi:hypothetical protein